MVAKGGSTPAPAGQIVLDAEEAAWVRNALLVGLGSWGELDRLEGEWDGLKVLGQNAPVALRPRRPDSSGETVSDFACALAALMPET